MNERLYRSNGDRMIAGVAGGLAERLRLDPSLVRIIWVLLVPLTGGVAFLVYIVMAIVVPEEDAAYPGFRQPPFPGGAVPPPAGGPPPVGSAVPRAPGNAPAAGAPNGFTAGPPLTQPSPQPMTRSEWRAQRRAERHAGRAFRDTESGALVLGGLLIVVGVWLLIRQYVPGFDPDRFWPVALVGLGLVLLLVAVTRRPNGIGGNGR